MCSLFFIRTFDYHQNSKADDQEQYSRRTYLLIHGLTETKTENTDEVVLDVINNKLNIEMSQINIDRSHRLGKRKGLLVRSHELLL